MEEIGVWVVVFNLICYSIVIPLVLFARRKLKRDKEKIADFAVPVLKKKGKVSLSDIATNLNMGINRVRRLIGTRSKFSAGMLKEGYFEDAYLEGGMLIKPSHLSVEDRVYGYIIEHGGKISLSKACEDLGLEKDELRAAIGKLRREGMLEAA